ncbi:LysR family transcriptional regulator [Burkholderia sp. Leaf177]|uniref:LysR family transcriptional regulator n=1 Tax=Burkholderia sp. Leaf177 TaxID=1736287 RepID=UPI0012E36BA0|nr:LysR family transcriptional regulator [Burkholderia sp. Leaf177]
MTPKNIDLNLLRIFDAVMSEMSVTRAARNLHMSQPAVSNALNRLRYLTSDDLFVKTHGVFSATPRAKLMWPAIHESLAKLDAAVDPDIFDPASAIATLKFGMSDFVASQSVIPLYVILEKTAPNISINLLPHNVEDMTQSLENGYLDMAAGVHRNIEDSALRTAPLGAVPYVCVMRRDHPLAKARFDREVFLNARHLVVSTSGRQGFIDRQLEEQGFKRKIGLIVNHFAVAPHVLLQTDLISVLPKKTVETSNCFEQLVIVQMPITIRPGIIRLAWHARTENIPVHRWIRESLFALCKVAAVKEI